MSKNNLQIKRETLLISSITSVLVQEKDLTRIIPAVSTSIAVAGTFTKGPIDEVVSISSDKNLCNVRKPTNTNFEIFLVLQLLTIF